MAEVTILEGQEGGDSYMTELPFILQILATVIGVGICMFEATYAGRHKTQDNKERFEAYRRRYKWEQFDTETMLHESDEDEVLKTHDWLGSLAKRRDEVSREQVTDQIKQQGLKLGLDMSVLETIENHAQAQAKVMAKVNTKKRVKKRKVQQTNKNPVTPPQAQQQQQQQREEDPGNMMNSISHSISAHNYSNNQMLINTTEVNPHPESLHTKQQARQEIKEKNKYKELTKKYTKIGAFSHYVPTQDQQLQRKAPPQQQQIVEEEYDEPSTPITPVERRSAKPSIRQRQEAPQPKRNVNVGMPRQVKTDRRRKGAARGEPNQPQIVVLERPDSAEEAANLRQLGHY